MPCYFCNQPRDTYLDYYCDKCSKLRRIVLLYQDRVLEVCESVLLRGKEKQDLKILEEIKKEIEEKQSVIKEGVKTRSQSR